MPPPSPLSPPPDSLLSAAWRSAPHLYAAVASAGRWRMYPHLRHIGNRIAQAIARGNGRLIVNCPPRHGKSELVLHWTPVWFLDNLPQERVILCSYGDALAGDFGRTARNELESNPFCRARLRPDSTAAQRWNTPQGGGMITAGVGGPIAGKGFSLGVLDDVFKNWQEAHSPQTKELVWEWFHSTFLTRAKPGATILIAMTRWGEDDLVGRLLAENAERRGQGAGALDYLVCAQSRSARGRPLDRRNTRARFISACRVLGPERQAMLTIPNGRHTCASHLLAAGWPLPAVRDLLGHANLWTTSLYSHVVVDDLTPPDPFAFAAGGGTDPHRS